MLRTRRLSSLLIFGVAACSADDGHDPNHDHSTAQALVTATVNPSDNADQRDRDLGCAAAVQAPMRPEDLVGAITLTSSNTTATAGTGGTAIWSGTSLRVTGTSVTLPAPSGVPFYALGFYAQNNVGSIAPGNDANIADPDGKGFPLLLQLDALDGAGNVLATLRFWTYQGLRNTSNSGRYTGIGRPDSGMDTTPAYLGIGRTQPFVKLRVTALNATAGTLWSLDKLSYSPSTGNRTCWRPDATDAAGGAWRLVTDAGEAASSYTHVMRTEARSTGTGHSAGHYWEFNAYNGAQPSSGSRLQHSGASGGLVTPAVQLRNPSNGSYAGPYKGLCDRLGQGDWLGIYHWSHFHFQGMHETDDLGLASRTPFDYNLYCGAGAAPNVYRDTLHVCEAYQCCLGAAPIVNAMGAALPPTSPALLAALSHPACGATCVQTMQLERDACLSSPGLTGEGPAYDRRLSFYTLDNGRTWRSINHMNNRYHNGYPGQWVYNHAHVEEDGDGMLGTDVMAGNVPMGYDWDQDGIPNTSAGYQPTGDGEQDTQFGYNTGGQSYVAPAMRVRFLFEERGTGECSAGSTSGTCAGWRIDDVALDYNEECAYDPANAAAFYDTLGDADSGGTYNQAVVTSICTAAKAAASLTNPCTADDPATVACYSDVYMVAKDVYATSITP